MGLRADSARPQRVSGSARTDSQRAESARNPIASHVNFGDDSALSTFTRTQWTAAFTGKSKLTFYAEKPILFDVSLTSHYVSMMMAWSVYPGVGNARRQVM